MNASTDAIMAWSYGLAGCIYGVFAIYLSARWRSGLRSSVLLVIAALSSLWGATGLAFALTGNAMFLTGNQFADLLRFGGWTYFLLILLRPDSSSSRLRWMGYVAVSLLAVGIVAQIMMMLDIRLSLSPGRLALLDSLAMAVFSLVLIEQLFRSVSPDWLWSLKPLCIGLGGATLFDLYLFSNAVLFNQIDADAFGIRGFVHALVVPLVAASTIRSHDWRTRIVLSQRVALQSVSLIAVGIYLLFMAAAGYYVRYFGGEWGRAFQLALLFAALLLLGTLGLSGAMRAKFRVLIGKHFFRYRYDYREEWLRFTNTLSAQSGFTEMGQHVVKGLANMLESPGGSLWLKDPTSRFFAQAACWNMPASEATEDADSTLCQFLCNSGWVVNLEEYRSLPARYGHLVLPAWLVAVPNAWLIVPLAAGNEMIGFVILATARTRVDINWEVNDLLKTAGRQAGAFLGQMQATEALLEARKFDAFNRMSAFVVHDLKNIVSQLSLMLKNAERHRDNPEFQKDMQMTVEHAVERMRQLMMQLRDGSTPVSSSRGVDLSDVIRRIHTAKIGQGRDFEIELTDKLTAQGHEDRVERVIGHVVQNAIDATEEGGQVWVKLRREGDYALVEVGDNGLGMTPEFVRERLFKPFQTTKQAGMGIGAYESFQYVTELGGKISVDSAINAGTQVKLLLPLFSSGDEMDTALADEMANEF